MLVLVDMISVAVLEDTSIVPVLVSKYSSVFCGVIVTVILPSLLSSCVIATYVLPVIVAELSLDSIEAVEVVVVESIVIATLLLMIDVIGTVEVPASSNVALL